MKILVTLVSRSKKACTVFEKQHAIILNPQSLPKDMQEQVGLTAKAFNPVESHESLDDFLLRESDLWDGIVLLVDSAFAYEIDSIRNAFFIGLLDLPNYVPNFQNVFAGKATRLLKNFSSILRAMSSAEGIQATSLPLRNFNSDDLRDMASVCREYALAPCFYDEFSPLLGRLLKCRGPKRRSQYPTLYFVDNDGKHFEFGKEVHCKPGTGGAHVAACQIHVKYRFGRRIDSTRHFNVTQGDKDQSTISGNFLDCHGAKVETKKKSHINMFSSDFHD